MNNTTLAQKLFTIKPENRISRTTYTIRIFILWICLVLFNLSIKIYALSIVLIVWVVIWKIILFGILILIYYIALIQVYKRVEDYNWSKNLLKIIIWLFIIVILWGIFSIEWIDKLSNILSLYIILISVFKSPEEKEEDQKKESQRFWSIIEDLKAVYSKENNITQLNNDKVEIEWIEKKEEIEPIWIVKIIIIIINWIISTWFTIANFIGIGLLLTISDSGNSGIVISTIVTVLMSYIYLRIFYRFIIKIHHIDMVAITQSILTVWLILWFGWLISWLW